MWLRNRLNYSTVTAAVGFRVTGTVGIDKIVIVTNRLAAQLSSFSVPTRTLLWSMGSSNFFGVHFFKTPFKISWLIT
jgi:hypothetical protein